MSTTLKHVDKILNGTYEPSAESYAAADALLNEVFFLQAA